jgi:predicted DNA-binding helix-hairpin-helix protein
VFTKWFIWHLRLSEGNIHCFDQRMGVGAKKEARRVFETRRLTIRFAKLRRFDIVIYRLVSAVVKPSGSSIS